MTISMEIPDLGDDFQRNIFLIQLPVDTDNKHHYLFDESNNLNPALYLHSLKIDRYFQCLLYPITVHFA